MSRLPPIAWLLLCCACGGKDPDTKVDRCQAIDGDDDGHSACSDCDDADAQIYPGAADPWYDGVDSDCSGNDDFDQDGDGDRSSAYGYQGLAQRDCDDTDPRLHSLDHDGDGTSSCDGDCDDSRRDVHPNAVRQCGDGRDNDCDGLGDCHWLGEVEMGEQGLPEVHGVDSANRIEANLIVDRSGQSGLWATHGFLESSGVVLLFPQDLGGRVQPVTDAVASADSTYSDFTLGDVTGDGVTDLIVATQSAFGPDVLWIHQGPIVGHQTYSDAAATLTADQGWVQGGVGTLDRDGDGNLDLYITVTDNPQISGLDLPASTNDAIAFAEGPILGAVGIEAYDAVLYSSLGRHIHGTPGVPDLDGDGVSDLVVVEPNGQTVWLVSGPQIVGSTAIEDLALQLSDVEYPVPAGDVNGDGYQDLTGLWYDDGVKMSGLLLGPLALVASQAVYPAIADVLVVDGERCRAVGDLDGDGLQDVALDLAPSFHYGPLEEGTYDVATDSHFVLKGPNPLDAVYGGEARPLGDVDGDGLDDMAVSYFQGTTGEGSIFLVTGMPLGVW